MAFWYEEGFAVTILTTRAQARLYEWQLFRQLLPDLNAIVQLSSHRAVIRSSQSHPRRNGWLAFGSMVWSEHNNEKWCTKYLNDSAWSPELTFHSTEIWTPGWTTVVKKRQAPDIFVKVDNRVGREPQQGLVVAARQELARDHRDALRGHIESLRNVVPACVAISCDRPWARPFGALSYADALADMPSWSLVSEAGG